MKIFPAIDIRGGNCVRLVEGDFNQETIFSPEPEKMALKWQSLGAEYLHLVDLDGALAGTSQNLAAIKKIIATVDIPIQLGGGIRNLSTIESLLTAGISRVILGSIAVKDPHLVKEAVKLYGDKIVVGIDAKNGKVAVEGWGKESNISATELGRQMADVGVARIIFTDIARDGRLEGVNVAATVEMAEASKIKIIASGGVKDLDDIIRLQAAHTENIEGVIVGKSIYTGSLDLQQAILVGRGEHIC